MALAGLVAHRNTTTRGPRIKRGDEILEGPYPQSFAEFIGQDTARTQLLATIESAQLRDEPMDHILLASGSPGIGKTALGRLTANLGRAGFIELGGAVTDKDVLRAVRVMQDGDVLFLDEVHRLVAGGKAKAEWLLTLLQDGVLQLPTGVVQVPAITVIATTTDAQRLPETILDRFPVKPLLVPYTVAEAVRIAMVTARRLGFGTDLLPEPSGTDWLIEVAQAGDCNPRRMSGLLTAVRDVALSTGNGNLTEDGYDLTVALQWSGLTRDGLTRGMQDYLVALYAYGGTAGAGTLKALLTEVEIALTERHLIQRGYITITPRGRELTDYGMERATLLAHEQGDAA